MNKAELSKMLEEKVREKVGAGYEIPTYAMDLASTDRLKRDMGNHGRSIHPPEHERSEWEEYLSQVEAGTYHPDQVRTAPKPAQENSSPPAGESPACGSNGLWRVRRH